MDADAASEIGRKHFEEAFAGARRSVANNDLAKFDQFRKKFDPVYKNSSSGDGGLNIQWPDGPSLGAATAAADDDDDLYPWTGFSGSHHSRDAQSLQEHAHQVARFASC